LQQSPPCPVTGFRICHYGFLSPGPNEFYFFSAALERQ
jgi:hypothetical protein